MIGNLNYFIIIINFNLNNTIQNYKRNREICHFILHQYYIYKPNHLFLIHQYHTTWQLNDYGISLSEEREIKGKQMNKEVYSMKTLFVRVSELLLQFTH